MSYYSKSVFKRGHVIMSCCCWLVDYQFTIGYVYLLNCMPYISYIYIRCFFCVGHIKQNIKMQQHTHTPKKKKKKLTSFCFISFENVSYYFDSHKHTHLS